ncbi:MAG: DUF4835 family protein [Cytophagales bacterium]|nr:DUF4835 family protein [Cytophagales bacterium]
MKKVLCSLLVLFSLITSYGQELNANVVVNLGPRVQTSERAVFRDMETAFSQFLNTRKWTNDNFSIEERIDCNLVITIEKMNSVSSFEAAVQIQSARPIYNTNYESILLNMAQNYADNNWNFDYVTSQPLEFNENSLQNNITAILAYYAYIIIGIDYDSFSKFGGTQYFEKARNIANNADQQFGGNGWKQFVSPPRNRYWLAENLNSPQLQSAREAMYDYHRLGLDTFDQSPDESRKSILDSLKKIRTAFQANPNAYIIILFLYAKSDELINIFSEGDLTVRRQAYEILAQLQPTKTSDYQEILSN